MNPDFMPNKPMALSLQDDERRSLSTEVVEYTKEHRQAIAASLGACLVVQRTYGKQGEDIATMTKVFCAALSKYRPEQVMNAMNDWLTTSAEFPTPYDIQQLIDPKPVWSPILFQELLDKRKRGDYLTFDEQEYIKQYKNNALKGIK